MERWVVLSNCQTRGLVNCLSLQNLGVQVDPVEIWSLVHEVERFKIELQQYDRIFVTDEVLRMGLLDFSQFAGVMRVPYVEFGGYHPDICYVWTSTGHVKTPMSDYHSIICLAAFKKGLSEADTRALYNRRTYESGGYFQSWDLEKQRLFAKFDSYGFDFSAEFRRWTMRDSFMYSINHPTIHCLYDVAAQITRRCGREPVRTPLRPHDNIANGNAYPIYDEIAESIGIEGSYLFKPGEQYSFITLEQFIAGSFESYRNQDPETLVPQGVFVDRFNAIFHAI